MMILDTKPCVLPLTDMNVRFNDLKKKLGKSANRPEIVVTAQKLFDRIRNIWHPRAVYRWCEFRLTKEDGLGSIILNDREPVAFDFGHCARFLNHASHALAAVYTAGQELETESKDASLRGDHLAAYLIDLMGLIVLEKTGRVIKEIAEEQARKSGWGVSPFLSPGSVHGWELEGQKTLCGLLPIEKTDVTISENGVLSPFKTISCLIGLGPGYDTNQVGETCQVCSKRSDCRMKKRIFNGVGHPR